MGEFGKYFKDLLEGVASSVHGLASTFKHLVQARHQIKHTAFERGPHFQHDKGIVTLEYPYESIPVPDHGRYRLHNEIDDCIVCDKCAKVCPVNCIDIQAIKATEEIGVTSDGTSKRLYAGVFDIDMAKCCYCGLCTTVCPTECLTMTSTYDYSEFDIREMNYHFTDLSPEQAEEKRVLYAQKQAEKAASAKTVATSAVKESAVLPTAKPSFTPKFPSSKPAQDSTSPEVPIKQDQQVTGTTEEVNATSPKPVFKPKIPSAKPATNSPDPTPEINKSELETPQPSAAKPVFKPKIPAPKTNIQSENKSDEPVDGEDTKSTSNKSVENDTSASNGLSNADNATSANKPAPPRPVFKPKMPAPKPAILPEDGAEPLQPTTPIVALQNSVASEESIGDLNSGIDPNQASKPAAPKPVFKPKMPAPKVPPKPATDTPTEQ